MRSRYTMEAMMAPGGLIHGANNLIQALLQGSLERRRREREDERYQDTLTQREQDRRDRILMHLDRGHGQTGNPATGRFTQLNRLIDAREKELIAEAGDLPDDLFALYTLAEEKYPDTAPDDLPAAMGRLRTEHQAQVAGARKQAETDVLAQFKELFPDLDEKDLSRAFMAARSGLPVRVSPRAQPVQDSPYRQQLMESIGLGGGAPAPPMVPPPTLDQPQAQPSLPVPQAQPQAQPSLPMPQAPPQAQPRVQPLVPPTPTVRQLSGQLIEQRQKAPQRMGQALIESLTETGNAPAAIQMEQRVSNTIREIEQLNETESIMLERADKLTKAGRALESNLLNPGWKPGIASYNNFAREAGLEQLPEDATTDMVRRAADRVMKTQVALRQKAQEAMASAKQLSSQLTSDRASLLAGLSPEGAAAAEAERRRKEREAGSKRDAITREVMAPSMSATDMMRNPGAIDPTLF